MENVKLTQPFVKMEITSTKELEGALTALKTVLPATEAFATPALLEVHLITEGVWKPVLQKKCPHKIIRYVLGSIPSALTTRAPPNA